MRIAVTTATGKVGSRVAHLLIQAGVRPVLVVRDPSRLDPAVVERSEPRTVDLDDGAAVTAALAGVDALFWVCPPTPDDDPAAGYARLGRIAADAVASNGIRRVVFLSSSGAEARGGFGEIDGLGQTEELLDAGDADVAHLRCGYFFANLLMDTSFIETGELLTTLPTDLRIPWVDPRDIGDVAAARLLGDWSGRVVQAVHGPADLCWDDVAAIVGAAVGRKLTARQISDDEVAGQLRAVGMTVAQVEGIIGMSRGLRDGFVPENPRDLTTTTPTSLASWAYEHLRPLAAGAS